MYRAKRPNDSEKWFMEELKARIVAESGRPEDRFHLGKLILQSLKDAPDFVLQIDGVTGESETFGSVLERTVRCANAFRRMGLKVGDVIILMAPNHLDLCIPYYAALYLGVTVAPIDMLLQIRELQDMFVIDEPKVVFCQSDKAKDVWTALKNSKLEGKIVSFDKNPEGVEDAISFEEFMKYGDGQNKKNFKASDFDPVETIAFVVSTSGTTGLPKQAAQTHKNSVIGGPVIWNREFNFPTPTRMFFMVSPLQWMSAILNMNTSPIMRITRLQSSLPITPERAYQIIKTYKPTFTISSPTLLTTILMSGDGDKNAFTSFDTILLGGSAVPVELITEIKTISPRTHAFNGYGMSEASSIVFTSNANTPFSSCGQPASFFQYRLVNVDTQEDIVEANVSGELWIKGPTVIKGYYKNPEATKSTFAEDGWFRTGDMFYRDEHWNFFFVERIKLLLKYRNHQISPVEIENVIRQLAGVLDVAVTGIPDKECGELPVACVVTRPGHSLTAQQIKDMVKENLTDTKQLRGGVLFLDAIPMTATTKVNYRRLKEIAATTLRE